VSSSGWHRNITYGHRIQSVNTAQRNRQEITAEFPQGVNGAIQYGDGIKAHAVYLSQYQWQPYKRIEEYFFD
jgi:hypothetical protein